MTLIGNWSYPTQIKFGAGRIREISEACNQANIKNPLLVTDKGLSSLPITSKTLNLMKEAGLGEAFFSDVDPNPNEKNLTAGITAFREGNHDGVIAFGGGSGLDLGKLMPLWLVKTVQFGISKMFRIGGHGLSLMRFFQS